MSLIAVVDTETTGTDPKQDRVIEASWALVDVETAKVVRIQSVLMHGDANPAEAINGIPPALLKFGEPIGMVSLDGVEAVVAHNAEFDRQWGLFRPFDLPWLDTRDWRWPRASSDAKLVEIALAHGVGVTAAHRAYTDVLTLCALLERVHETVPLKEQLAYARLPRSTYEALVPFAEKDKAKQAGFQWKPEAKVWVKRMLPEDAAKLNFKTRIVA